MYGIRYTLLSLTLSTLPWLLFSAVLHRRVERNASNSTTPTLLTLVKMTRADFDRNLGAGHYKILHSSLLDGINLADIIKIQAYFMDEVGTKSEEGEHINDLFEIMKVNCHRHLDIPPTERLITSFNVPDYDFYKKGIRITNITHFATRWLGQHMSDDALYLKIQKKGDDPVEGSYRFAYNPNHIPMLIIRSRYHHPVRVTREVSGTPTTPFCTDLNNRTQCCLEPTQVPSTQLGGILHLAELPDMVTINRCAGLCPITTGTQAQDIINDSSRPCCRRIKNLYDVPTEVTIYDGFEADTVYSQQLNATDCTC